MSSPITQMNTAHMAPTHYVPVDTTHRHNFGVQKNKKQASTGGGRAWSEDEEVYLLQTRLQKMPYKHIAAHLKKTELACRLHYHQLSHGSNRRKRTGSVASSNGSSTHSPIMSHAVPAPISESVSVRSTTPQSYTYSPQSPPHVQLPSAASLLNVSGRDSPIRGFAHPVAILPKPTGPRRVLSDSATPLRLNCDITDGPSTMADVDQVRLRHIYEAHRTSFWNVIATEYGSGASALLLEETWKHGAVVNSPPTPCVSPDSHMGKNIYQGYHGKPMHETYQLPTPVESNKNSATSISALLGIDASPRSPQERELIKAMEDRRDAREIIMQRCD